jgi:hypothetical protein
MADVSETLQRLMQVRNQLLSQLKEVDELMKQLQAIQTRIGSIQPRSLLHPDIKPANIVGGVAWRRSSISPADIADSVEQILREANQPMTRSQIARRLTQLGVPLVGRDINKNVGTILWRHRHRFVNLKKLGYWLADVAIPDVYEPQRSKLSDDSQN